MPLDILLITAARALLEVAGLMLLLRGAMWIFGPKAREVNFFYAILTAATMPFIRLARKITPRVVRDLYTPLIAFILVLVLWIASGIAKEWVCAARSLQCV